MRTTLTIDDDVLEAARKMAEARELPLGKVVSQLMRRGLVDYISRLSVEDGFPTFRVSPDSPPIGLADVERDEDEPG